MIETVRNIVSNDNIKRSVIHIINNELKELFIVNNEQKGVKQLILENHWTDFLKTMVDLGNTKILKNFQLNLVMEEEETNV
jgi:hypothetical protein